MTALIRPAVGFIDMPRPIQALDCLLAQLT